MYKCGAVAHEDVAINGTQLTERPTDGRIFLILRNCWHLTGDTQTNIQCVNKIQRSTNRQPTAKNEQRMYMMPFLSLLRKAFKSIRAENIFEFFFSSVKLRMNRPSKCQRYGLDCYFCIRNGNQSILRYDNKRSFKRIVVCLNVWTQIIIIHRVSSTTLIKLITGFRLMVGLGTENIWIV